MYKKTHLLPILFLLVAVGISACGRGEEVTPIPYTPTFTPTPAAPIIIHVSSERPGAAPRQMPAAGQAVPPAGLNQPSGIVVAPTPAVLENGSDSSLDLNTSQSVAASTVSTAAVAIPITTRVATAVAATDSEQIAAEASASSDTSAIPSGPGRQMPDLASIAAELGVTEDALEAAMGEMDQGPPDFASIAAELGVAEEALMEAFGGPGGPPGGGSPSN